MSHYTINEPHPTVATNSYTHSGRGGAGNMFRAPATTSPSGIPTKMSKVSSSSTTGSSSSSGRFYSGRGGAGNTHMAAERATLSFDEEFSRAEVREKKATMVYAGRGGAGNIFSTTKPSKQRKHSSSSAHSTSSRRDSVSTEGSMRSGFLAGLSRSLSRS